MKVVIASDHAGLQLKEEVVRVVREMGETVEDLGVANGESVDYPDYGIKVAEAVADGKADRGILVCGTGIGMCIVANKVAGIRAALCHDLFTARMSRMHNDANILVLAGRVIGPGLAAEMVKEWLTTPFEGGRHQKRLDKIKDIEEKVRKSCSN
ncbi:MAG: ribose 5-phosphate isomerase B [Nitrospirota bacterium]|nr:ribose 5-phosphate isomerase B [Nitrospirota bacterium]